MDSSFSYAVSYLRGRDEAWVGRFLDDLDRRLRAASPVRFLRWPALGPAGSGSAPGGAGGTATASRALAEADRVLVLCSPAYFAEGPADADWAVLAHRASLERARGRAGSGSVLPLLWEPIPQRLPDAVAEADTFTAAQPPEYRSLGLALMTMQAARHRAALDQVLDNLTQRLTAAPAAAGPVPVADLPDVLPQALASDDARFTALFRAQAAEPGPYGRPPRSPDREVRWREGGADRRTAFAELATAGRRLLLLGPAGAGRSRQLAALTHAIVRRDDGDVPWDCRLAFRVPAASGALPAPDGIVAVAAPALAAREPAGWAARQLRAGHALLTVEGLDRAPHHLRTAAWEWLLRMVGLFPQAAFVVETNGTSVPWHRVAAGAFTPVTLQPLAPEQRVAVPDLRTAKASSDNGSSGGLAEDGSAAEQSRTGPGTGPGTGAEPADADAARPGRTVTGTTESAAPGGSSSGSDGGDPLLRDVAAWPGAAEAVRLRASGVYGQTGAGGRIEVLRAAVTANWRPDTEAANSRTRVRDSVLRAAAGGLAAATLEVAGPVPQEAALDALDGLRDGGAAGVPPDRLLSQLADDAGLLYAPRPGSVAFATEAVRNLLTAEYLAAHPGANAVRLLAAHAARTGSADLALLIEEVQALSAGGPAAAAAAPGLLAHGGTGRRLTAEPLPAVTARTPLVVVHTLDELLRLAGGPAVPELRCEGRLLTVPPPGSASRSGPRLAAALAAVPGLRSLVIADHPRLRAVPDLACCTALRSLRLVGCPALRDLSAVARSALMFLSIDPCRDAIDLGPLRDARWLRRVELRSAGAPPGTPPRVVRLGRTEVRRYEAADRSAEPPARLSRA